MPDALEKSGRMISIVLAVAGNAAANEENGQNGN